MWLFVYIYIVLPKYLSLSMLINVMIIKKEKMYSGFVYNEEVSQGQTF